MGHVEISHFSCEGGCREFYQVRLYGEHRDNYVSAFLIQRPSGSDVGELGSLAGPGFYRLIGSHIRQIYKETCVVELKVKVLSSHSRLMQRVLRDYLNLEVIGSETFLGRQFTLISMTLKESTPT